MREQVGPQKCEKSTHGIFRHAQLQGQKSIWNLCLSSTQPLSHISLPAFSTKPVFFFFGGGVSACGLGSWIQTHCGPCLSSPLETASVVAIYSPLQGLCPDEDPVDRSPEPGLSGLPSKASWSSYLVQCRVSSVSPQGTREGTPPFGERNRAYHTSCGLLASELSLIHFLNAFHTALALF